MCILDHNPSVFDLSFHIVSCFTLIVSVRRETPVVFLVSIHMVKVKTGAYTSPRDEVALVLIKGIADL